MVALTGWAIPPFVSVPSFSLGGETVNCLTIVNPLLLLRHSLILEFCGLKFQSRESSLSNYAGFQPNSPQWVGVLGCQMEDPDEEKKLKSWN